MSELNEQWARLLAAGKVRWMPGMLPQLDDRVVDVSESGKGKYITLAYIDRGHEYGCNCSFERSDLVGDTPDWTDPATLGCLCALVQDAWRNECLFLVSSCNVEMTALWSVSAGGMSPYRPCPPSLWRTTKAGALLAAIEAAP